MFDGQLGMLGQVVVPEVLVVHTAGGVLTVAIELPGSIEADSIAIEQVVLQSRGDLEIKFVVIRLLSLVFPELKSTIFPELFQTLLLLVCVAQLLRASGNPGVVHNVKAGLVIAMLVLILLWGFDVLEPVRRPRFVLMLILEV